MAANWLQKRLKQLKLTHDEFRQRLAEQGIDRSRVTITNWVNENNINLLANPEETKRLAAALNWSVSEMLLAAGYEIGAENIKIPPELIPHIKYYNMLHKGEKQMYMESIRFVARMLRRVEDLDEIFGD